MNKDIVIQEFQLLGKDDRGETFSFSLPRKQDEFIAIKRKSGTISGNTYHEGKNKGTHPKVFLLISGEINFHYRHVDSITKNIINLTGPLSIEIKPNVVHSIEAVTDVILFECNSIADIQNDRIKLLV